MHMRSFTINYDKTANCLLLLLCCLLWLGNTECKFEKI